MNDFDTLNAQSLADRGDLLGDTNGREAGTAPARFEPARLADTPGLPPAGLYFGMSDEAYHALPALSNGGIKQVAASPMIFWANSAWLSERKRKKVEEAQQSDEKAHHVFGKAYHARIVEGRAVFESRFAVELDPADYPEALVHTAQIKAAIGRFTQMRPVKPVGGKEALIAQLQDLSGGPVPLDCIGMKVDDLKAAISKFEVEAPVVPVRKVEDTMPDTGELYMRDAVKADWIAQLLALDPEAQIFDVIADQHRAQHAGKLFLTPDQHDELEIAAHMVANDPEGQHAFKGGHAEVTLIWYCPKTGVPMKARVDYLKIKAMVDLKSIANQRQRSMDTAVRFEIAHWHYNVQPVVYFEGAREVRKLIREQGAAAIHSCDIAEVDTARGPELTIEDQEAHYQRVQWALKWAQHSKPDEWLWIFQQKGEAPITRGVWFPRSGVTDMVTQDIVLSAKRRFREASETFGTAPWLDVKPFYTIADEEIPQSATEI